MGGGERAEPRFVLVTGAARGIGRAVVARCAARGDAVIGVGRDRDALAELERAIDGDIRTIACDIADEQQVAERLATLERVDVLVNNAGTSESAPLAKTTLDSWSAQLAVNATGAFLLTRALAPGMRERGHGRIITVASTAGRVGAPYTAAYTASKHAAIGLMRAVAAELAGSGVTSNAVCPTFVDTDMTQRSVARISERTGRSAEEGVAALAAQSALGRLLDPGEVADAVLWLASDEAAAINGQAVVLDGGTIQT